MKRGTKMLYRFLGMALLAIFGMLTATEFEHIRLFINQNIPAWIAGAGAILALLGGVYLIARSTTPPAG